MVDDQFEAAVAEAVAAAKAEQKLAALEDLRTSVLKERRLLRVLTIAALIVGCVGIFLANDARTTLDEFAAARSESRVIACRGDNDAAERINGLNDRTQDLLRDAVAGNGDRTPAEQAAADAFLKEQIVKYEALKIPLRGCGPQEIEDYYNGDP